MTVLLAQLPCSALHNAIDVIFNHGIIFNKLYQLYAIYLGSEYWPHISKNELFALYGGGEEELGGGREAGELALLLGLGHVGLGLRAGKISVRVRTILQKLFVYALRILS